MDTFGHSRKWPLSQDSFRAMQVCTLDSGKVSLLTHEPELEYLVILVLLITLPFPF